jgi:transposase
MPKRRTLDLTPQQHQELVDCRDHHRLPYLRERAAALLFIADGLSPAHVARHRLFRPRDQDTVYTWLKRYQQDGLAGLFIRKGRGRKPAFFPAYPSAAEAHEAVAHVVKRDPRQFGVNRTRWNLPTLLAHLPEFRLAGPSSLWHVLDRLDIRWLRGRAHVHSPDPLYQQKRDYIQLIDQRVRESEGKEVLLYQDERSYEFQPLVTSAYAPGGEPLLAEQSYLGYELTRLAGVLNAHTGAVHACAYLREMNRYRLIEFYHQVCEAYPGVQRIWMVQDNSALHFHPDVLVSLGPQDCPFPFTRLKTWPTEPCQLARKRYGGWHLPIRLVLLPTYAPGLIRLRKCGASSSRSFYICTAMRLRAPKISNNGCSIFSTSGLPVQPTCFDMLALAQRNWKRE